MKRLDDFSEQEEYPLFQNLYNTLRTLYPKNETFTVNTLLNTAEVVHLLNNTISLKAQLFLFIYYQIGKETMKIHDDSTILTEDTPLEFVYSSLQDAVPYKLKKVWRAKDEHWCFCLVYVVIAIVFVLWNEWNNDLFHNVKFYLD